jgi:hypothetical protein
MKDVKQLAVIADRIRDALTELKRGRYAELLKQLTYLAENLAEIAVQSKRLRISVERGWLSPAEQCRNGVNRSANDASHCLSQCKQLTDEAPAEVPVPSILVEDLKQLQQEFGEIDFDKAANTLSVVTGPITLEEAYLGPFEIKLELNKLPEPHRSSPYYCIALDPHPAATSEDVTHPHVSNDRLCEGEGAAAIRAALEQGRLCDFFTIVRGILNTYSPDSPYVPLDEWDGTACYDCGHVVDSESSCWCTSCDESYCDQCCSSCHSCYETVCNGCSQLCHACQESTCPNCIGECAECGLLFCNSCLEEDLCPTCKQESEAEDERKETEQATTGADQAASRTQPQAADPEIDLAARRNEAVPIRRTCPEIQSDGLGEAAVLQG